MLLIGHMKPKYNWLLITLSGLIIFVCLRLLPLLLVIVSNLGLSLGNQILANSNDTMNRRRIMDLAINNLVITQSQTDLDTYSAKGIMLGELYWVNGDYERAVEVWNQSEIMPEQFLQIPNLTWSQEQLITRLAYLERAYALDPTRSEAPFVMGITFDLLGNLEQAELWYREAERIDNWVNHSLAFDVFYERGFILQNQNKDDEAEQAFQRALAFANGNVQILPNKLGQSHRQLGLIYQQDGKLDLAQQAFEKSIELIPDDIWNYLSLGVVADAQSESPEMTIKYFKSAHDVNPNNIYAYIYPANFYLNRHEMENWGYFCSLTPAYLQRDQAWQDVCN